MSLSCFELLCFYTRFPARHKMPTIASFTQRLVNLRTSALRIPNAFSRRRISANQPDAGKKSLKRNSITIAASFPFRSYEFHSLVLFTDFFLFVPSPVIRRGHGQRHRRGSDDKRNSWLRWVSIKFNGMRNDGNEQRNGTVQLNCNDLNKNYCVMSRILKVKLKVQIYGIIV